VTVCGIVDCILGVGERVLGPAPGGDVHPAITRKTVRIAAILRNVTRGNMLRVIGSSSSKGNFHRKHKNIWITIKMIDHLRVDP
jgi:hypothetical protein